MAHGVRLIGVGVTTMDGTIHGIAAGMDGMVGTVIGTTATTVGATRITVGVVGLLQQYITAMPVRLEPATMHAATECSTATAAISAQAARGRDPVQANTAQTEIRAANSANVVTHTTTISTTPTATNIQPRYNGRTISAATHSAEAVAASEAVPGLAATVAEVSVEAVEVASAEGDNTAQKSTT